MAWAKHSLFRYLVPLRSMGTLVEKCVGIQVCSHLNLPQEPEFDFRRFTNPKRFGSAYVYSGYLGPSRRPHNDFQIYVPTTTVPEPFGNFSADSLGISPGGRNLSAAVSYKPLEPIEGIL